MGRRVRAAGANTMTHGDWLNVQTEPATLLAGEPGSPFKKAGRP